MNATQKREVKAWGSRNSSARRELAAWGKAVGFTALLLATLVVIVLAGLSTI